MYTFKCNFLICIIAGKPFFPGLEDHIKEEAGGFVDGPVLPMGSPARSSPQSQGSEVSERFSRKVFVGGLPPDIDEGKMIIFFFQLKFYLEKNILFSAC